MTTTRFVKCLAWALLASGLPAPAVAQDGLIVGNVFLSASRDPGARLGAASPDLSRPLAGGGRYAVRDTEVVDLRSGRTWALPLGAFVLEVDPARPRAFVARNCDRPANSCEVVTWHFLTGDVVPLATIAYTEPGGFFGLLWPLVRYAVDADVVFIDRASNSILGTQGVQRARSVLPVNATTGTPTRSPMSIRFASWDVLPDASTVIVGATLFPPTGEPWVAEVVDVATDRVVAQTNARLELTTWEPTLQAIVSTGCCEFEAFDLGLRPLASALVGAGCSLGWQVSPHTGRIYLLSGGGFNYIGSYATHLAFVGGGGAIDVDLSAKAGLPVGQCFQMRVLSAPGPPRAFAASAVGHDVSLQWQNVGAASHFVLDVGFAPGRTDLSIPLGPDSRAAFAGVPSGTYFLRLRGGNEFGGGRPSQEVTLVVP